MPPPATFYTITSFPYSQLVTQADFNGGLHGNVNSAWFKYIPASDHMFGFYVNRGGTNNPRMKFYETSSLTLIKQFDGARAWNRPVTSGVEYWVEVLDIGGTATSDFDFTVSADTAVLNPTVSPGDFFINDDTTYSGTNLVPAIVMSSDGIIRGFKTGIPGGEIGDSVESGYQVWHDRFGAYANRLVIFDPDGIIVTSVDTSPTVGAIFPNVIGHSSGKFYVVNRNGAGIGKVFTITAPGGVVSGPVATIVNGGNATAAVGVNGDETIAYYAIDQPSSDVNARQIHRWDLVNNVALSDLYDISELHTDFGSIGKTALNLHPAEILVLGDDSIVTFYQNDDQGKSVLLHISSSGSLLHSYSYYWSIDLKSIDHISWDPNNPSYVRIWFFNGTDDNTGHIGRLTLATGELTTFSKKLFSAGVNLTTDDPTMFGPSSSCTMVTAKLSEAAAAEDSDDAGEGESGVDGSIPCCEDDVTGSGGGDIGTNPDPVGELPDWEATCEGGGLVDSVSDLSDGESWL